MNKKLFIIFCFILIFSTSSFGAESSSSIVIKVENQTDTGTLLANSKFEIKNEAGKVVDTLKTSSKGIATSEPLEPGDYTIEQIAVTSGCELNPKIVNVTLDDSMSEYTILFKNIKKFGSVTIQDRYEQSSNSNNTYVLYSDGKEIERQTTGASGTANFDDLAVGDYVVKNSVNASETYSFTIVANDQDLYKEFTDGSGYFRIFAFDSSGKPVSGSSFDIYDSDGNYIETLVTDKDGMAESSKLKNGEYYVVDSNDKTNKYYIEVNSGIDTLYIQSEAGGTESGFSGEQLGVADGNSFWSQYPVNSEVLSLASSISESEVSSEVSEVGSCSDAEASEGSCIPSDVITEVDDSGNSSDGKSGWFGKMVFLGALVLLLMTIGLLILLYKKESVK